MKLLQSLIFSVGVFAASSILAQIAKGDEHFANSEYIKAIQYYKKESKSRKSPNKKEALTKLASSYKHINNYALAEEAYRQAVALEGEINPEIHYEYAQILKANGKYEDAAVELDKYLALRPQDENARKAMKFCREIKYYMSRPVEYRIKNLETVNTAKSEFSPFALNGKLIFVAERDVFDLENYEVNGYNGEPYLDMYMASITSTGVKKSKSLPPSINSEYHDGPACLSFDGQQMYFTRSGLNQNKNGKGISRIFMATVNGKKWKDVKQLDIGEEGYSVGHPAISPDNNTMYFSSDMPGGYGGKDIWKVVRQGEGWGKPENLGPDINTSGDEMFPVMRKDGILFFSSNGLPGFGGLDIYSAKPLDGKWVLNRNEGVNINSNTDDFGITFLNDSIGYFSSNRAGGKGSDDIYVYSFKSNMAEVSGKVLLTENLNNPAVDKKVVLIDDSGKLLDSMRTDQKGYFAFKNLSADHKYMAVIAEDDPLLVNKARYYLAVRDSVIQKVTVKDGQRKFAFKNLPVDANALPDLYSEDEMTFAGTMVSGDKNVPMKNVKIRLTNAYGDVVQETTTGENGAFAFRNLPADQNYAVSLVEGVETLPDGTKITVMNKAGKAIKTFNKQSGKISYQIIEADKGGLQEFDVTDELLTMGLYGYVYDQNKNPLSNVKIRVRNEDGSNPQEATSAGNGRFGFRNLEADKNYIFEADETSESLKGLSRIFLCDAKGRPYKIIELIGGKFTFKMLEADKSAMGEFALEESGMNMAKTRRLKGIYGFVFDQNDKPIASLNFSAKNEDGSNPQTATSGVDGSFGFKSLDPAANYVFEADKKEPALKEVTKIRLKDNKGQLIREIELSGGKFVYKMLDADKTALGDFVEEEASANLSKTRKLKGIYGFMYNQNDQPLSAVKFKARTEDGTLSQEAISANDGSFGFKTLDPNSTYVFEADQKDPALNGVRKIKLKDLKGQLIAEIELAGGKFTYRILEADKTALGDYVDEDASLNLTKTRILKGIYGVMLSEQNVPLAGVKFSAAKENGSNKQEARTDKLGAFGFKTLDPMESYIFEADEKDPALKGVKKILLKDNKGNLIREIPLVGGKFTYRMLDTEKNSLGEFEETEEAMNMTVKRKLLGIYGFMFDQNKRILSGVTLKAKNEDGTNPQEAISGKDGSFGFRNLDPEKGYIFEANAKDSALRGVTKIQLFDGKGRLYKEINLFGGMFTFRMLESDKAAMGEFALEDAALNMGSKRKLLGLYGSMLNQDKKPLVGVMLTAKNEDGSNPQTAVSAADGSFGFRNLDTEQNYVFEADDKDPALKGVKKILLFDAGGKLYKEIDLSSGKFVFRVLEADKSALGSFMLEDAALNMESERKLMGIYGFMYDQNRKPLIFVKLIAKNEDGSSPQEATSGVDGSFGFKNLDSRKNYVFEADQKDPGLSGVTKILLCDNKGRVYREIELSSGKFVFKILQADKAALGEYTIDEPELTMSEPRKKKVEPKPEPKPEPQPEPSGEEDEFNLTIVESIYYAYGQYSISPQAAEILDKAADIMQANPDLILEISSHTDAQSSAKFNMGLSCKRAQAIVNYLVKKGVNPNLLSPHCYGETKVLNHCLDGVNCTDEEHKINRRTEFKFIKKTKKRK
jgi:outer membrane protein OmpA-like peptidoglycan-associated protein